MNKFSNSFLITILIVILLTYTVSINIQNNINTKTINELKDEMHPIINIAEGSEQVKQPNNYNEYEKYSNYYSQYVKEKPKPTLTSSLVNDSQYVKEKPKPTLTSNLVNEVIYEEYGRINEVTIKAEKLPNGQYAYKLVNHILKNKDGNKIEDLSFRYPKIPTIPGPTIEINSGDLLVFSSIDEQGYKKTQKIKQTKPGSFEYYGERYKELGLFGAFIVNSKEKVQAQLDGKIVNTDIHELDKQYVLFMLGSTFWGQEIDSNHIQKPLWTNPVLGADLNQLVRFHIFGAEHQHTFHLDGHKWLDPSTTNIIDTKLIDPSKSHWFIVKAGDNVGVGNWQYDCHVFAHMQSGMKGTFKVGLIGSDTESVPGSSPLEIGPTEQGNFVTFELSDEPGKFFRNVGGELLKGATESLGIVRPNGTAHFIMTDTNTVHSITSLVWPTNASHMPFDQTNAYMGGGIVKLEKPGLYIFTCKIHPYMLASVIVDDPITKDVFDLGDDLTLSTGIKLKSSDPKALAILKNFFIANNPSNWQDYRGNNPTWTLTFPDISVKTDDGIESLNNALLNTVDNNITQSSTIILNNTQKPSKPGIGEVWIDTQFEETANKTKPGTATQVNVETWEVKRKVSLPEINMNNPHNMWSDSSQEILFQTQWFDNRLTAFSRDSGELFDDIIVGDAPSHVMTNPINDLIYVALSGERGIAELKFNKEDKQFQVLRIIPMQESGEMPTNPNGHWITSDGNKMLTPNLFTNDATIFDFITNSGKGEIKSRVQTGMAPTAVGMMPDGKTAYIANFLSSSLDVVDMNNVTVKETIDLKKHGHALPIQTPVSPNGEYVVTANTLTSSIAIIDTETNQIVKNLKCDPGCHGVNFGAKEDGGYYGYVSSKFSNRMLVVDGDPNNDGNPEDAMIAGSVLLTGNNSNGKTPTFETDDTITKYDGMGGQGIYAIPNVYAGWVEKLPLSLANLLTEEQRDPVGVFLNARVLQVKSNTSQSSLNIDQQIQSHNQTTFRQLNENITVTEHSNDMSTQTNSIDSLYIGQLNENITVMEHSNDMSTQTNSIDSLESKVEKLDGIISMLPIPYP